MKVKATDVKALREKTGAGMLDCKNALVEAEGDFSKAEKILKELGLAAVAKRSGKAATEGRVFSKVGGSIASLIEISCETDFVARNRDFIDAGKKIADIATEKGLTKKNEEVNVVVDDMKGKIKENIDLKRLASLSIGENEIVKDYIHGEGKIGVLVKAKVGDPALVGNEEVQSFVFDCALHIAAFNPLYLTRDAIDPNYIEEQQAIFTTQAMSLDKPENVVAGIVKGKLNKHLSEIVMMDQGFVREEKKKVSAVMDAVAKSAGGTLEISEYLCFRVGEE
ncbi:MAG: translation elongation factor Ts [Spirochaetales bacterium]|nr:translation elongation factor Ts [Spirochaetales bacterium]